MSRFIRTAVATLATLPGLLLLGGTAAFARTDDPALDPGTPPPPPVPSTAISFAHRVEWMGAGAGILLALIVGCVAAVALIRRHQRVGQLRTT